MSNPIRFLIVVVCVSLFVHPKSDAQERVFVRVTSGTNPSWLTKVEHTRLLDVASINASKGADALQSVPSDVVRRLSSTYLVEMSYAEAMALPNVEEVFPNRRIRIEELEFSDDDLSADQFALGVIGAQKAWEVATGKNVFVGVLDTGIDWDHPDLVNQLWVNAQEDANNNGRFEPWSSSQQVDGVFGDLDGVDNDGNGYVDDVIGYDFVDQSVRNLGDDRQRDPIPFDEQGHGTSVAGVIGAEANNGIGIAGCAYNARIVTLRAFDATGNAEEDDIAAALVYAALNGVRVVNMSFGDGVDSPVLRDAIKFAASAQTILVASAGNSGGVSRQFPAGYDEVIAVGATNRDDEKAFFSSTGSLVNLTAPGEQIITTAVDSRYRTVNGTSFAAPYAAATAAMLLEVNPLLSAVEVSGILQSTSTDLGKRGWDQDYGTGRLQADAAVSYVGSTIVTISEPSNESEVATNEQGELVVIGSVIDPLFNGFEISVGAGIEPTSWAVFASEDNAVLNDTLARIPVVDFEPGVYVVRLLANLKNGRTIESRRRVHVLSAEPLTIVSAEIIPAWQSDRQVAVVTIETSRRTTLRSVTKFDGSEFADSTSDIQRRAHLHSFVVDPSPFGTAGMVSVTALADNGDIVDWEGNFNLGSHAAPVTGVINKGNAGFAGYVLDTVVDLYNDGQPYFSMASLLGTSFGKMVSVTNNNGRWALRDSTADVYIPRAIGDANGNGRLEVFGHVVGKAVLFEASTEGGSPFSRIIYQSNDGRQNAAGMFDLTGDGNEELLILSDTACTAFTFDGQNFVYLSHVRNPTEGRIGNADNRVDEISIAHADFDGDGNIEVAFGDTDGDLVVAEFANGSFRVESVFENEGIGGSGYVGSVDIDGDGTMELYHGVPDNNQPLPTGEYGRQVWTYRLYRADSPNSYREIWKNHFWGVRYGIGFRNGHGAGNIDGIAGEELLVCAFPRMYVFGVDSREQIVPKYFQSDVVSPRFLTHDFDNNGKTELGFGTTVAELGVMTDFSFIEFDDPSDKLATPSGVRAELLNDSTVYLSWMPVEGATAYRVFGATTTNGLFREVDTVADTRITIDTLQQNIGYRYRVSAITLDDSIEESFRSAIVDVLRDDPATVVSLNRDTVTNTEVSTGLQLEVMFSRQMPERDIEPSAYVIVNGSGEVVTRGRSAVLASHQSVLVGFDPAALEIAAGPAQLVVGTQLDAFGVPTITRGMPLEIVEAQHHPTLYAASFVLSDARSGTLTYSLPVDESALVSANYSMKPLGAISRVERVNDSTVDVFFSADPPLLAAGTTYSITITNVASTTGLPITLGVGNTVSFVLAANTLEEVFVYPHPVSLKSERVTFANLTRDATIEVLDQRFNIIATINEVDGNGGASWNMRADQGVLVPPGLYFYRVKGANDVGTPSESGLKKLMIVR